MRDRALPPFVEGYGKVVCFHGVRPSPPAPMRPPAEGRVVAVVEYRDGRVSDVIRQVQA